MKKLIILVVALFYSLINVNTLYARVLFQSDFNSDGKPDILWRNETTGQLVAWYLDGINYTGYAHLSREDVTGSAWRIVGTGDFNADGKSDILWRNETTGQNVVWYLNGKNYMSDAHLSREDVTGLAWKMVGLADFNGDYKPDILWRNETTGKNVVWYLDGINYTGYAHLTREDVTGSAWKMVGLADFNGDNKPDILWRNETTGQNVIWYLDGINYTGYAHISREDVTGSAWKIVGLTDFNGDSKPDILWRNETTGKNVVWYLDGINYTGYAHINREDVTGSAWTIVASGSDSIAPPSGTLDTTFGIDGKVITGVGSGYPDEARALVIQSDGRIVATGYSDYDGNRDFALVRYNANGSLDTTFGTGGKVTTAVGSGADGASALGIQSDGKIVVAGSSSNGINYDFALVRYNANGSLDTSFGIGGIVTTPVGSSDDEARALVIQSDGRIVVAGNSWNGSDYDFAIVRYNANGSLDTSFGMGGIVTTPVGSGDDYAYALGIQSNGRLVAAGISNNIFALVRYDTNGNLDTTFGTGGIVTTAVGSGDEQAHALVILSDGKIVVAGYAYNGSNQDFALVKYNTNGSLDTTFGTGGKVRTDIESDGWDYAYALGIQSNGRLVAAGISNNIFALVRYDTNGNLDTTFGTGGIVTTRIGNSDHSANALCIQSDDKIVAAGYSNTDSNKDFALVRYWP